MAHGQEDRLTSLVTTLTHEARLIRHAGLAYTRARSVEGLAAVERALDAYYDWRVSSAGGAAGDLTSVAAGWRSAELLAINPQGWGQLSLTRTSLHLVLTGTPELRHYAGHDVLSFAVLHYRALAAALGRSVGTDQVSVELSGGRLELVVGTPSATDDVVMPAAELDGPTGLDLLHATTENRASLMVFLGREAENSFGSDGEEMFREAIRGFGSERGSAMRLSHLSNGLTLDLVNMLELYDSGGNTNVWRYRDDGVLTPEVWSQDCTHCPFVDPWRALDGLRYGEIYDHEFHYSQFKAYREDIEVRWGELQSRGDATCEFRFTTIA